MNLENESQRRSKRPTGNQKETLEAGKGPVTNTVFSPLSIGHTESGKNTKENTARASPRTAKKGSQRNHQMRQVGIKRLTKDVKHTNVVQSSGIAEYC